MVARIYLFVNKEHMKAERELNNKILDKTLEIQESFPELYVFLDEVNILEKAKHGGLTTWLLLGRLKYLFY